MKGLSPLVATVILIAFVVSVAAIIGMWIGPFILSSIERVESGSTITLICTDAHIGVSALTYCNNRLAGIITNTGKVTLGNITLEEIFDNKTTYDFYLCKSGSSVVTCSGASNLTLTARQSVGFNISIGNSNYDRTKIKTNCTSAFAPALQGDVTNC